MHSNCHTDEYLALDATSQKILRDKWRERRYPKCPNCGRKMKTEVCPYVLDSTGKVCGTSRDVDRVDEARKILERCVSMEKLSRSDEAEAIRGILESYESRVIERGDVFYVISRSWYMSWKTYVGYGDEDGKIATNHVMHPGPIDNLPIMMDEEEKEVLMKEEEEEEEKNEDTMKTNFVPLRARLVRKDFVVVPQEAWILLRKWYGLDSQSKEFRREVFRSSWGTKSMRKPFVDLYPIFVTLAYRPQSTHSTSNKISPDVEFLTRRIRCSSRISIDQLRFRLGPREYNLDFIGGDLRHKQFGFAKIENGRLCYDTNQCFSDPKKTLEDLGVSSGDTIAIWTRSAPSYEDNDSQKRKRFRPMVLSYFAPRQTNEEGTPKRRGAVGLHNLGNTCYMNAALQCLSHTALLTETILSSFFQSRVVSSKSNKKLVVSISYAEWLEKMWSNKYTTIAPREVKSAISSRVRMFRGFTQHDSQELLQYLLQELLKFDEDIVSKLIRVKVRIVKTCTMCNLTKSTSDPRLGLALPLPEEKLRLIPFVFVPWKRTTNTLSRYGVWVQKDGNCNDLKRNVSDMLKISCQNIVLAEVTRSNKIRKLYRGVDKIVFLSSTSPLVIYEMPVPVYSVPLSSSSSSSTPSLGRISSMNTGISLIRVLVLSSNKKDLNNAMSDSSFLIPIQSSGGSSKISSQVLYDLVSSKFCNDEEFELSIVHRNDQNDLKSKHLSHSDSESLWSLDPSTHHLIVCSKSSLSFSNLENHISLVEGERKLKARQTDLSECLGLFHAKEIMCDENAVECDHCKTRTKHHSSQGLESLPPVLVFHLQRFTQVGYTREKLDTFVKFPLKGLDMSKYVNSPSPLLYDCYAVVHHQGGYGGGHYVAHARDATSWCLFDDARITTISAEDDKKKNLESEIVRRSAYLLFYERRKRDII